MSTDINQKQETTVALANSSATSKSPEIEVEQYLLDFLDNYLRENGAITDRKYNQIKTELQNETSKSSENETTIQITENTIDFVIEEVKTDQNENETQNSEYTITETTNNETKDTINNKTLLVQENAVHITPDTIDYALNTNDLEQQNKNRLSNEEKDKIITYLRTKILEIDLEKENKEEIKQEKSFFPNWFVYLTIIFLLFWIFVCSFLSLYVAEHFQLI